MSRRRKQGPNRASAAGYELADDEKEGRADAHHLFTVNPANDEVYDPRQSQRIPAGWAWAMIVRQLPPMERRLDEQVRVGRIFYVEHLSEADGAGFLPDGTYKVISRTPWGDVCLWPYEYSRIDATDLIPLWSAGEVIFHPINIAAAHFNAVAFYCRTRGIGLADAAVMALGSLSGSVGWFEPRADLAEDCEAMERRVHAPDYFQRRPRLAGRVVAQEASA